jgi:hypothetical protein
MQLTVKNYKKYSFKIERVCVNKNTNRYKTNYVPLHHSNSLRELSKMGKHGKRGFVYIFKKGNVILYIGQTEDVISRMANHSIVKRFGKPDKLIVFPVFGMWESRKQEKILLSKFETKFNTITYKMNEQGILKPNYSKLNKTKEQYV